MMLDIAEPVVDPKRAWANPVRLRADELEYAAHMGLARRLYATTNGLRDGQRENIFEAVNQDVLGGIAEYVLSVYLGVRWNPTVGKTDWGDFGSIECKGTEYPAGKLMVAPRIIVNDSKFVLATPSRSNDPFVWFVRGWMLGREIASYPVQVVNKYRPPCHVVMQSDLHNAALLRGEI